MALRCGSSRVLGLWWLGSRAGWLGQLGDGHDGGESGDRGFGPGPGFWEAEVLASRASGQSGGDVEESVAQGFRFAGLQGFGKGEEAEPRG